MKRLLVLFFFLFAVSVFAQNVNVNDLLATQDTTKKNTKYEGFIFTKLGSIGTRSEGPEYYIQLYNYKEIHIIKNGITFQSDKVLDKFVGKKAIIEGEMFEGQLRYTKIKPAKM